MATWPASLPQQVEMTGFQENVPNVLLRTQMDVGPPKVRRRSTAGVRSFPCRQLLTKAQVATLETFFITTLSYGVTAFDWVHPRTQASASLRFVKPPTYTVAGPDAWYAAYEFEILP